MCIYLCFFFATGCSTILGAALLRLGTVVKPAAVGVPVLLNLPTCHILYGLPTSVGVLCSVFCVHPAPLIQACIVALIPSSMFLL